MVTTAIAIAACSTSPAYTSPSLDTPRPRNALRGCPLMTADVAIDGWVDWWIDGLVGSATAKNEARGNLPLSDALKGPGSHPPGSLVIRGGERPQTTGAFKHRRKHRHRGQQPGTRSPEQRREQHHNSTQHLKACIPFRHPSFCFGSSATVHAHGR